MSSSPPPPPPPRADQVPPPPPEAGTQPTAPAAPTPPTAPPAPRLVPAPVGELPVSLLPAGTVAGAPGERTELPTLVVEPAPVVVATSRTIAPVPAPVVEPELPVAVPEPDLPDLFSDGTHLAPLPTTSVTAVRSTGGFLPPPALVPADAPDLPMSAASATRAHPAADLVADPEAAPPPTKTRGRSGRSTPPKPDRPAEAGRRRPSWLIPAVGALAVVAGGTYLVAGRDSGTTKPTAGATTVKVSAAPTSAIETTAATQAMSTTAPASSAVVTTVAPTTATTTTPATTTTVTAPVTEATVASTEAPVPVPSDFPPPSVVTGTGNRTFKIDLSQPTAVILEATHKGTRNFIVKALDAKGGTLSVPINQVGAFSGSVVLDPAASLQITADGAWSVTIKPLLSARQIGSAPTTGKGSEVVLYSGPAVRATVGHSGQRTFAIEMRTKTGTTTIVNEVGSYQGSIDLPEGITVLGIVADGSWSLTPV